MDYEQSVAVREACDEEGERTAYPGDFPALPSIPAARYFDRRLYDLEMEHVWRKVCCAPPTRAICPRRAATDCSSGWANRSS